jgi:hypothetical protein
MIARIMRAIRLDFTVFREIAEDEGAMSEAAIIVIAVSVLSAFGGLIGALINRSGVGAAIGGFFVSLLVAVFLSWIGWAVLTFFIGTRLFEGRTDIPEMMRVLGYANAPNLLGLFSFIPCVGWIFSVAGAILSLIAGVLAVREAMEFDTGKAVVTVVIGWVVILVISAILGLLGLSVGALAGAFG